MTISAPSFTRLQTGVPNADDLRVRGPVNVALAYLGGSLVTQLNTHFGAVSNSVSAALALFRATANTWTAAQTFSLASAGTNLVISSIDAGAGTGPIIAMDRNSATPASGDFTSSIEFRARNSIGATVSYALFAVQIVDVTDGSEDGRLFVRTVRAGAAADWYFESGALRYSTQTQPSNAGEIAAVAYKVGASQVVGARVTGYGDPFGALSRATISVTTVTTTQLAQFVNALYTDLKTHGLIGT